MSNRSTAARVGELTPQRVAPYIAKYATKSAEDFGLGGHRITPVSIPYLNLSEHVETIVRSAWELGGTEAYAGLRRWLHMAGFRGHTTRALGMRRTTVHMRQRGQLCHGEVTADSGGGGRALGVGRCKVFDLIRARPAAVGQARWLPTDPAGRARRVHLGARAGVLGSEQRANGDGSIWQCRDGRWCGAYFVPVPARGEAPGKLDDLLGDEEI
jgi:hypothetical protein